jgi:hypothetical protein
MLGQLRWVENGYKIRVSSGNTHGHESELSSVSGPARVGCTNSVVDWIHPICSEIVFMHPTAKTRFAAEKIAHLQAGR